MSAELQKSAVVEQAQLDRLMEAQCSTVDSARDNLRRLTSIVDRMLGPSSVGLAKENRKDPCGVLEIIHSRVVDMQEINEGMGLLLQRLEEAGMAEPCGRGG